jgi:CheY-like chemotaxis protein
MPTDQQTILVVEDEPIIRLVLIEALQDEGYLTLAASSVLEAIGLLGKFPRIDGLVTDVDLPGGLSGLDLLELFNQCRPTAAQIVVSGRSDLKAGDMPPRARFFSKPYSLDGVIAELDCQIAAANAVLHRHTR